MDRIDPSSLADPCSADRPLAEIFAQFVADHDYSSMPESAHREAKRAIRDCVGGAIAGLGEPVARIVSGQARGIPGPATVWGAEAQTSADAAALINGTLAHAHAIDDTNESMRGHPSVPVLPALFAMAEELDAGGRSLIAAYIMGVEIAAKLGRAVNDRHAQIGWHTTATLGPVGAAAGVAHLAGLGAVQTRNAIALAASLAGGLRANFGTMAKALMPGVAARNGILAARLAGGGFTAGATALEAPEGFLDMFCGKEHAHAEHAVQALGRPLEVLSPGIVYKLYPNCSLMHSAIDMVLEGVAEGLLHAGDMVHATCRISGRLDGMRLHRPAANGAEAKFSVEHCLAYAMSKGTLGFEAFDEPALADPEVRRLLPLIRVEVDNASDPGNGDFAALQISHRSRPEFARSRSKPLGHPSNPLSEPQMRRKFMSCVEPKFGRDRAYALWDALGDLENQSVRAVGRMLAA